MAPDMIEENLSVEAHIALRPVLHALHEEGIAYQTHVKFGDTGEALLALADEPGFATTSSWDRADSERFPG